MFLPQRTWSIAMFAQCGILFGVVYLSLNHLPLPKSKMSAPKEDFIEEIARSHLSKLVELGHRPAGSIANDVDAVNYIVKTVSEIQKLSPPSLKFEVDIQHPTGSFNLDFLSSMSSYYSNITNTIVKIFPANGGSKHGLLLNCHTDTAVGSPGASDDAVACAVLLEVMRAFVANDEQPLLHPLIFLFNGAEENILQASHGFITQHPWAKEVKAFINLEAAGAGGKELVFQTGPSNPWLAMTWAAHAPHPFGTVIAQELFQSGVIPADTDFRIFRDFGSIPGIDLAYMRNGYVYHTVYDNAHMIQPGSIQRAGDNILAVIRHLVKSKSSMLPNPSIYKHGSTAFMDVLGVHMLIIPMQILVIFNWACSVGGLLFIVRRIIFSTEPGFARYGQKLLKAVGTIVLTWVACFLTAIAIALLMTEIKKPMSFYSKPSLVVFLYVFPGILSMMAIHRLAKFYLFKNEDPWKLEGLFFDAFLLLWCLMLFQANYLKIQSSLYFLLSLMPILIVRCLLCKNIFSHRNESTATQKFLFHMAAIFPHCFIVMNIAVLTFEFFIPLCNRLGSDASPDLIIGLFSAAFVCLFCHFTLSTVHVVKSLGRFMLGLLFASIIGFFLACSCYGFPYAYSKDAPTTKRLYIQHISREFYHGTSDLVHSDSGLWTNTMDYIGFDIDMGSKVLMKSSPVPCTGIYCHSPWILPIHHLIRNSRYIAAGDPFLNVTVHDPLIVKVVGDELALIRENSTTSVYLKRLSFIISGPSHMSIQIGTFASKCLASTLTGWSLDGAVENSKVLPLSDPIEKKQIYNDWHYIYYGSGISPVPWRPWFEFLVYRNKRDNTHSQKASVEFGFTAHHFSTDRNIPSRPQTEDIRRLTRDLRDWVMHISWISSYKNYLL